MSAIYKYIKEINIREGKEIFKLMENPGLRKNGYKLAMNEFGLEISEGL